MQDKPVRAVLPGLPAQRLRVGVLRLVGHVRHRCRTTLPTGDHTPGEGCGGHGDIDGVPDEGVAVGVDGGVIGQCAGAQRRGPVEPGCVHTVSTVIRLTVSVPVLSEPMTVVEPRVSTLGR